MTKKRHPLIVPTVMELQALARDPDAAGIAAVARAVRLAASAKRPTAQPGHDGKPPVLVDARGITKEDRAAKVTLKRNMAENPVDRMFHKRQITAPQREAGLRLLKDWELSQVSPMRGMDYSSERVCSSGGQPGLADARCDAMTRLGKAMRSVGTTGRGVLTAVVIDGDDFQCFARRMRWNQRAVGPAVQIALDMLVVHYRITRSEAA